MERRLCSGGAQRVWMGWAGSALPRVCPRRSARMRRHQAARGRPRAAPPARPRCVALRCPLAPARADCVRHAPAPAPARRAQRPLPAHDPGSSGSAGAAPPCAAPPAAGAPPGPPGVGVWMAATLLMGWPGRWQPHPPRPAPASLRSSLCSRLLWRRPTVPCCPTLHHLHPPPFLVFITLSFLLAAV